MHDLFNCNTAELWELLGTGGALLPFLRRGYIRASHQTLQTKSHFDTAESHGPHWNWTSGIASEIPADLFEAGRAWAGFVHLANRMDVNFTDHCQLLLTLNGSKAQRPSECVLESAAESLRSLPSLPERLLTFRKGWVGCCYPLCVCGMNEPSLQQIFILRGGFKR